MHVCEQLVKYRITSCWTWLRSTSNVVWSRRTPNFGFLVWRRFPEPSTIYYVCVVWKFQTGRKGIVGLGGNILLGRLKTTWPKTNCKQHDKLGRTRTNHKDAEILRFNQDENYCCTWVRCYNIICLWWAAADANGGVDTAHEWKHAAVFTSFCNPHWYLSVFIGFLEGCIHP